MTHAHIPEYASCTLVVFSQIHARDCMRECKIIQKYEVPAGHIDGLRLTEMMLLRIIFSANVKILQKHDAFQTDQPKIT